MTTHGILLMAFLVIFRSCRQFSLSLFRRFGLRGFFEVKVSQWCEIEGQFKFCIRPLENKGEFFGT